MWLDQSGERSSLEKLLLPFISDKMEAWRVSPKVSVPAFDNPDCFRKLEKAEAAEKKPEPAEAQASLFD
jgi:putative SOS response-associated peptidase YedK